jgi:hypothetical protein
VDKETEGGLENIDDVAEIMVGDKTIVGSAAGYQEVNQLICVSRLALRNTRNIIHASGSLS